MDLSETNNLIRPSVSTALGHDYAMLGVALPSDVTDAEMLASYAQENSKPSERGLTSPQTQAWLNLRYEALSLQQEFSEEITPTYIESRHESLCEISGIELSDDASAENGRHFVRVCKDAKFERGSLISVSRRVHAIARQLTHEEILALYSDAECVPGLSLRETEILACMVAHCSHDRFVLTKFKYPYSTPELSGVSLTVCYFIQWGLYKSLYAGAASRKVVWDRMAIGLSRQGKLQVENLRKAMTDRFVALERKAAKPWMIFDDENCWKQFRIFWRIACAEKTLDPVFADFTRMFSANKLTLTGIA